MSPKDRGHTDVDVGPVYMNVCTHAYDIICVRRSIYGVIAVCLSSALYNSTVSPPPMDLPSFRTHWNVQWCVPFWGFGEAAKKGAASGFGFPLSYS